MDEKKILQLADGNQRTFLSENKRREGKKRLLPMWEKLVDEYYEFAKKHEKEIPYMYIDSNGFPTVGCGHLLGYDWWKKVNGRNFWQQESVKKILMLLKNGIRSRESIDYPEQVTGLFKSEKEPLISETDFLDIFKIDCVRDGLLESIHLPFQKGIGTKRKREIVKTRNTSLGVSPYERKLLVTKTYLHLIEMALMLRARQEYLGKKNKDADPSNPFLGSGFYDAEENYLVLDEGSLKNLARLDILSKISDLINAIPNFSKTPLPAQKGILDLSFSGASGLVKCRKLVEEEKWKELSNPNIYGRPDQTHGRRNRDVAELFKEAAAHSQLVGG